MICPKCRAENAEGRKFCRECGAELLWTCPRCGSENLATDKFCGECGHDLREPGAAPSIDYSRPLSYTPELLADKILKTRVSLEGERKLVTVLSADVANYTSISEKLDPEEVHQIMDGCFRILMDEVHRFEGTIDKFTGDGVVALFGAPLSHEDHAQRACHATLGIKRALEEYGDKIKRESGVDFQIRMGLTSGQVIVGSIGNDLRMDYTAIGDTTSIASRMQSIAEPGTILASPDTYRMAKDFFNFRPPGEVETGAAGAHPESHELLAPAEAETRFEAAIARGLTRFVGRDREIATLMEAFENARAGSGQVVGIVGEAGVGKSRLLLQFQGMLTGNEHSFLEGRCLHYGSSMAYLPLVDVLRSYFELVEGERAYLIKRKMEEKVTLLNERLKSILPPLQDILSLDVGDEEYLGLQPLQRRDRVFEAVRDLLVSESRKRPLVLALEDLHWIDRTSVEFLDYLIGWLASSRILLILLHRPEFTHTWGSRSYYSHIRVDQLSTVTSSELISALLEGGDVAQKLNDFVVSKAGGNPLFLEEFIHTLMESGAIEKTDQQYVLSTKADRIRVPDTIHGIVAARIDRLESKLKNTVQVASVMGRDFPFRILEAVMGRQPELKSHLLSLQGSELIYEKALFPELEYIFKHAVTREVAYNSLLLRRRKQIHERTGKAIEDLYSDRLDEFHEVLAHHFLRSDNSEKASQYLKLSGDKASRHYANWEAFRLYRDAINTLERLPKTRENERRGVEVRLLLEGLMRLLAYPEDSLEILRQGEGLCLELEDYRNVAILHSSMGLCHAFRGDPVQSREYTEEAFREAASVQDVNLMAPIAFDLCCSYGIAGEQSRMIDVAASVLTLLDEQGRQHETFSGPFNFNLYSALCAYLGEGLAIRGNFGEGESWCEKACLLSRETGNPYSMAFAETIASQLFIGKGDGRETIEHIGRAARYAEEGEIVTILSLVPMNLGWAHYFLGEPETALRHLERGMQQLRDSGLSMFLSEHYACLAMIHLDWNDMTQARDCAQEALRCALNEGEKRIEAMARFILGKVQGRIDPSQVDEAESSIMQSIDSLEALQSRPYLSQAYLALGELHADTGRREKALQPLKTAEGMFQEMGMEYWLRRTHRVLESLQAV